MLPPRSGRRLQRYARPFDRRDPAAGKPQTRYPPPPARYLPKPANTDDIEKAFDRTSGETDIPVDGRRTSIKSLEWQRIDETLVDVDFNISEAARRLGMHRRTLARKLEKRPVK
ncbi:MAG: hypothetical protein JNL61_21170 [Rhizobiaceae bacterium]|nr:hypothetical protein [Rhizobiaceae bacterium]